MTLAEYAAPGREDIAAAAPADRETRPPARAARRAAHRPAASSAAASRRRCVQRGRCEGATWPTWLDISLQAAAVEGAAERHRTVAGAVPAQLEHGRLVAGEVERGGEARRRCRWRGRRGRSRPARRRAWRSRRRARRASFGARRIDVDQRHLGARQCRPHRKATSAPTTPAPTTAMRSAGPGAASQTALSAVSMLAASTARARRHAVGQRHDGVGRQRRRRSGADAARRRCGRRGPPARPRPRRPWRSRTSPETGMRRP